MSQTVTVFDIDIPVWDYYTAGEREQLETLIATGDEQTRTRYDLHAIRIFLKTRCNMDVSIDDLLDKPIHGDELAEAVEVLVAPLFVTLKERAFRREKARVESLTDPTELKLTIQRYEDLIEALREKLSLASGHDEKP